jgi:hypothetical protein
MYSKRVTNEEFEMALMCVTNGSDLDYPFLEGYCHKKYISDFWNYFCIDEKYDVVRHAGLFITRLKVVGYNFNKVASVKLSKSKRKNDSDDVKNKRSKKQNSEDRGS